MHLVLIVIFVELLCVYGQGHRTRILLIWLIAGDLWLFQIFVILLLTIIHHDLSTAPVLASTNISYMLIIISLLHILHHLCLSLLHSIHSTIDLHVVHPLPNNGLLGWLIDRLESSF